MFSQQKSSTPPFSLGLPVLTRKDGAEAEKRKSLTAAEKYEQALVTAHVFIEDSRARLQNEMSKYSAVADSSYWFYGYFAGNACAAMALCLALGTRIPFLRPYSGWIALGGGYCGGKACMAVHCQYLLANVVQKLDHEISEAKRMDEQTQNIVPDYLREAERLKGVKYELMPTLPEAIEARKNSVDKSLDDKVDDLVEAYTKRREALQKK